MKSKFYDWFDQAVFEQQMQDSIFGPGMPSQVAVDMLTDYLLGEDWYSVNPISQEQVNTEIVFDILCKYSKKFRKEFKYLKKHSK